MSSLVSLPIFYAMSLQKEEKGKNHTTNPETNTMNLKKSQNKFPSWFLPFSTVSFSMLLEYSSILQTEVPEYVGGCLKKGEQNPLV